MDPRSWLCTLLAPSACIFCGVVVVDFCNGSVCQGCWQQIHPMRADCHRCGQQYAAGRCSGCSQCSRLDCIDRARSYGAYLGELGTLLRHYKYRGDRSLAPGLTRLLRLAFDAHYRTLEWDALVPVATHPSRVRERGFDHMELLGRLLGKQLGLPLRSILVKRLASRPQAGLSERLRRRNVRRSFAVRSPLNAAHILLLDDIFTTGATVNECARVLRRAGAFQVGVLTVARAE